MDFLLLSFYNESGMPPSPFALHWSQVPSIQGQYSQAMNFKDTTITFTTFHVTLHQSCLGMWPTVFLALYVNSELDTAPGTLAAIYADASGA